MPVYWWQTTQAEHKRPMTEQNRTTDSDDLFKTVEKISAQFDAAIRKNPELAAIATSVETSAAGGTPRPEIYLTTPRLARRHRRMIREVWRDLPLREELDLAEIVDVYTDAGRVKYRAKASTRDRAAKRIKHTLVTVKPPIYEWLLAQIKAYFAVFLALAGLIPVSAAAASQTKTF